MKKNGLRNKKVLVMGLGLHGGGLATVRWLVKHGARVTVTDLKTKRELEPSLRQLPATERRRVRFRLGRHRISDFQTTTTVIQNPGVPRSSIYLRAARRAGATIENDASLFFSRCPAPIVGVTGTRGKSTTASLIAAFLAAGKQRVWLAGLPQQPLLGMLDRIRPKDIAVLELSSWQLEVLGSHRRSPQIAVLTNFYPDHLNRYPTMGSYLAAKKHIFAHQPPTDLAIINRDNPTTKTVGAQVRGRRLWFSKKQFANQNGCFVSRGTVWFRQNGRQTPLFTTADIRLPGEHNLENVLAAACVAAALGVSSRQLKAVVKRFHGLDSRLQTVTRRAGVTYVNDTAATTPQATIAALRTVSGRVVLIAGGASKKIPAAEYQALAKLIAAACKAVVLFAGPGSELIIRALRTVRFTPLVTEVPTMVEAVSIAASLSERGDVVLLSPASASFGLFTNEFDRGTQFEAAVKTL